MQQLTSTALLAAIFSFTVAAAGSLPRGVAPEFAQHYQAKDQFACITNGAIKLSLSQINDNSCDCPDGSDEPGTAACAFIDPLSPQQPLPGSKSGTTNTTNILPGFWCANKGHIGAYVPFVYVNDGVCDYDLCCDGTEEITRPGGVKCQNKCAEIGKEYRRVEAERKGKSERADKKRQAMIKEAQDAKKKIQESINSLEKEVEVLEVKRNDLHKKFADVEREEKSKVVKSTGGGGGKLGVLVGLAKARVDELRNTLDSVLYQRDGLKNKVDELETILRKFKDEYNPNFNDEGVKAAVKSWEDYAAREVAQIKELVADADVTEALREDDETSGVNWKEFDGLDESDDTDVLYSLEAYLPSFLRSLIHERLNSLRVWLIENGMLADNVKAGQESSLVKAARATAEAAEKELTTKTKDLEKEQSDLNKDYGPSDIFRALKGKCVSTDAGEYTYELCWLDKTNQKSKKGGSKTQMGVFEKIDWKVADDEERADGRSLGKGKRMVLRYDNGQSCWNGPRRRTDVWLGCAETEEVWRVSESEKCVYKMEVGTPAACDGGEARAHDEL